MSSPPALTDRPASPSSSQLASFASLARLDAIVARPLESALRLTVDLPHALPSAPRRVDDLPPSPPRDLPVPSNGRSIILLSPRRTPSPPLPSLVLPLSPPPAVIAPDSDPNPEEDVDQEILFINSLRAGHTSRDRRRTIRQDSFPPLVIPDLPSSSFDDDDDDDADIEQSEVDDAMQFILSRSARDDDDDGVGGNFWQGWDEFERQVMDRPSRAAAETLADENGSSVRIWRNDPIDVRRYSDVARVPRGGAALARAPTVGRTETMRESADRSTVEAQTSNDSTTPFYAFDAPDETYSFSWTRTRSPELLRRSPSPLETVVQPASNGRLWSQVVRATSSFTSLLPPSVNRDIPTPPITSEPNSPSIRNDESGRTSSSIFPFGFTTLSSSTNTVPISSTTTGRRTREETSHLMGQALRMKKPCWLLYCGARQTTSADLPGGWHWNDPNFIDDAGEGCGALVCARGLAEVPRKVFDRSGKGALEDAVASDLAPCATNVGESTGRMSWSTRGVAGCKGCATSDLACRNCGNLLGYRVVTPCTPCKVAPAASVSGLWWHYRRCAVTLLPRLNGIIPSPSISLVSPPTSPTLLPQTTTLCDRTGRLIASEPLVGTPMRWGHLPHAQIDFEDGLVGEPSEWFNPDTENLWLVPPASKNKDGTTGPPPLPPPQPPQQRVLPPLDPSLHVLSPTSSPFSPLPSVIRTSWSANRSAGPTTTTVDQGSQSVSGRNRSFGGTHLGASLSRSGAIRRPHTTTTTRAREDDFEDEARRVRPRVSISNPDANDVELDRLMEVAGYGVAFEGTQGERSERMRVRNLRAMVGRNSGVGLVGR